VVRTGLELPLHPTKIRRCGRHIVFSGSIVKIHMELFMGSDAFIGTARSAFANWGSLQAVEPTPAFFQTCTNVARCLGVALLEPVMDRNRLLALQIVSELRAVFRLGLRSTHPREAVEDEFLDASRILHIAEAVASRQDGTADALMPLLGVCLRPHGAEKVERITANFRSIVDRRASEN